MTLRRLAEVRRTEVRRTPIPPRASTAGVAAAPPLARLASVVRPLALPLVRPLARPLALPLLLPLVLLFVLLPVLLFGPEARAGPEDARRAWERAQTLRSGPWRPCLAALREARREAGRTDPLKARTLVAEARLLASTGHAAAARAAEAAAVALPPRHDPSRLGRLVSNARPLLADEDTVGARPLLEEARALGRAGAPAAVAAALPLLARLAADVRDFETIDRLADEAGAHAPQHPEARLRILDLAGMLALGRGDAPGARRRLDAQRRCFADAVRGRDDAADRVSRVWLALELPRRMDRVPELPRAP